MAGEGLVPLALTDISTGEELLVWGVGRGALDGLLRAFDDAARKAGAVGCAVVGGGAASASEVNRAWLEDGPKVAEAAERALAEAAGAEGGPDHGR